MNRITAKLYLRRNRNAGTMLLLLLLGFLRSDAQSATAGDSLVMGNDYCKIIMHLSTGHVSYRFAGGVTFENTVAYAEDLNDGMLVSANFQKHSVTTDNLNDPLGQGTCINLTHESPGKAIKLIQYITFYKNTPFILVSVEATSQAGSQIIESRNISPVAVLPQYHGKVTIPGNQGVFTDYPFDNDNWVDIIARRWPDAAGKAVNGISYELASAYDQHTGNGFVAGSVMHDFWKTGIHYSCGNQANRIDSLIIYGGAATKDNPALPDSYGGKDGTHDYVAHGKQSGTAVYGPLIYLAAGPAITKDLEQYGEVLRKANGIAAWNHAAPFYWNSFGVEGVLGYSKVMMPGDVAKISDYLATLQNFNRSTKPVLSIDSYDQDIYSTSVLQSISRYGKKKGQQMGFYFIPFALWTWKNNIQDATLTNTDHPLREVILQDETGKYIPYKDGDWGAFPLDPTHPYTRDYIIKQLQKAKAIDAKFIKIDFLTAGALESSRRYDPAVKTGIQAYNYGMKLLRHLVDSLMGPDIFITQAISPMFPNQYAHTRFLSTDVYSHLRNDIPGYPHYGSTSASMISATNLWWTQGNLWPYTNMDVVTMKRFQNNKDISAQDAKVRLLSMLVMGSILGDGSDFRDKQAAERGRELLNNKALCDYFSNPKAFTPLNFPVGTAQDQQLSFYLPGSDTLMVAAFNFKLDNAFNATFPHSSVAWQQQTAYKLEDVLTGREVGSISKGQESFQLNIPAADAMLIRLVPQAQ